MNFIYNQPTRITFGIGCIEKLPQISRRYGSKCLLVGPEQNDAIQWIYELVVSLLEDSGIDVVPFLCVEPNPHSSTVQEALALAWSEKIEFVLAVGGGSSIDVGKLVASCYSAKQINFEELFQTCNNPFAMYPSISDTKLPLIAVPTTSGTGSQFTQAAVITDSVTQLKLTVYHPDQFAKEALIDPQFMKSLPPMLTASTAFDAFTHAFEPFIQNEENPLTQQLALEAIRRIVTVLPKVLEHNELEYRESLALADCYAGISLANGGAALPHPISEIIGSYVPRLNHGQALSLCYPAFLKYTADKYRAKFAAVCRIMDPSYIQKNDQEAAQNFHLVMEEFLRKIRLNLSLGQFGVTEEAYTKIRQCEILDHLPMESKETIRLVLEETLERGKWDETY